ncbi:hypothetical protein B9Z65_4876 [Elsinoe australis]|uniref:triacylglycerol lipase n=1 Tax=Elsinoe australis TaxID=40998 RepID=A0A2P8A6B1_9PEZI|nr:hypothetical protein B9Z65_4876 [Elsinoe australis]
MLLTNIFVLSSWTAAALAWSSQHDQQVLLPPIPGDRGRTPSKPSRPFPRNLDFSLRHIYHAGSHKYPGLLRKVDVHADTVLTQDETSEYSMGSGRNVSVSSKPTRIERMADRSRKTINSILEAGRMTGQAPYLDPSGWTLDEIEGPNVTDKQTVLSFAIMAANAYITKPGDGTWEEAKGGFNYTEDFGWEQDGLRGHIFADTENSTIVIGLKGTSMAIFDGADTTGNDKDNDNLFGSCCCGQGGQYLWKQVCDCMTNTWTCNNTCLTKSLREKSHYYHAAMDLYHNVTERYPDADVWLTGHSLGGVVTALLGLTYGLPVVTFEAFPDALAASRLGLPTPPGYRIGRHQERNNTSVYHFGHTADPVFTGTCNTATSGCTIAGYAFESQCHTGSVCTYDTVGDLGWRVGVSTHRITNMPNSRMVGLSRRDYQQYDDGNKYTNNNHVFDPRMVRMQGSRDNNANYHYHYIGRSASPDSHNNTYDDGHDDGDHEFYSDKYLRNPRVVRLQGSDPHTNFELEPYGHKDKEVVINHNMQYQRQICSSIRMEMEMKL